MCLSVEADHLDPQHQTGGTNAEARNCAQLLAYQANTPIQYNVGGMDILPREVLLRAVHFLCFFQALKSTVQTNAMKSNGKMSCPALKHIRDSRQKRAA
jgi:hypothetical protein